MAGSPKISPNSNNAKEVIMKNIYIHPKYRQKTTADNVEYLINDICLIQLKSKIKTSKNIGLVKIGTYTNFFKKLAKNNDDFSKFGQNIDVFSKLGSNPNPTSKCFISGWGTDEVLFKNYTVG